MTGEKNLGHRLSHRAVAGGFRGRVRSYIIANLQSSGSRLLKKRPLNRAGMPVTLTYNFTGLFEKYPFDHTRFSLLGTYIFLDASARMILTGLRENMNTAVEIVRLRHDMKHYQSELHVVTNPRDMRVLIEVIALGEARLRELQETRHANSQWMSQ